MYMYFKRCDRIMTKNDKKCNSTTLFGGRAHDPRPYHFLFQNSRPTLLCRHYVVFSQNCCFVANFPYTKLINPNQAGFFFGYAISGGGGGGGRDLGRHSRDRDEIVHTCRPRT